MKGSRIFTKELAFEWVLLTVGCVIYAVSIIMIDDVNIIPGSFLGIAVALNKAISLPTGMVNLLLNIPLMIIVTRKLGVKVLVYTIFIMVTTSVLIDLWTPVFPSLPITNVYILSAVGGLCMGVGAGMLIRAKGTMAGTTALTLLIQRKLQRLSFGTILFAVDSLIVLTGTIIVGDWRAIPYSLLYSFCCAKMMDVVICLGVKKAELKEDASEG